MFQMNMQFFDQCWPEILGYLDTQQSVPCSVETTAQLPPLSSVTEAGYVLGVAIGYAVQGDPATCASVSMSVPGWRADACGADNWPQVLASSPPSVLGIAGGH